MPSSISNAALTNWNKLYFHLFQIRNPTPRGRICYALFEILRS